MYVWLLGLVVWLSSAEPVGLVYLFELEALKKHKQLDCPKIEHFETVFKDAVVLASAPLSAYLTDIKGKPDYFILLLRAPNGEKAKVLFKPASTRVQQLSVGVYKTAEFLRMEGLILPVAPFIYEDQVGIVTYFLDTEKTNTFWDTCVDKERLKALINKESLQNYHAFTYLLGLWDLWWKNTLLKKNASGELTIVYIDTDGIERPGRGPYGEHLYVASRRKFPNTMPEEPNFNPEKAVYLHRNDIESLLYVFFSYYENREVIAAEPVVSKKYSIMYEEIDSFLIWDKEPIKHFFGEEAWWMQIYGSDITIPAPYTTRLNPAVLERLLQLDFETLKGFFEDAYGNDNESLSESFYSFILERRNAIVEAILSN